MASVSAASPGVTDVLQMLSNLNSPLLSSSSVTSALKKASTSDVVQLSMAATQLEGVDAMFGMSNSSSAGTTSPLASLEDLLSGSGGTSANTQLLSAATANASTADQLATAQTASQLAETQALLFGSGATGSNAGSMFDLMG
jgi:hypothetical protein